MDKEFIIPVSWSVYSTVVVRGVENLQDAKKLVEKYLDDIPLAKDPEYIDDSYKIDAETDEDLENAQDYVARGVLLEADPENPDTEPKATVL